MIETFDPEKIKTTIKNVSNKNYKIKVGIFERFIPKNWTCFCEKNKNLHIYNRLTMKMLKYTSFENLIKLTKNTKIIKNVVFYECLRNISKICLYPQKFTKISSSSTLKLNENFIELVKNKDPYANNFLNFIYIGETNFNN